MAHNYRFRHEYDKPRRVPVNSSTEINQGDLLFLDPATKEAKPASDLTWNSDLLTTQKDFAKHFIGLASQHSAVGNDDDIRVATAGVGEFECESGTFDVFDFLAPAKQDGEDKLENQKVAKVARRSAAVLEAYQAYSSTTTSVKGEMLRRFYQFSTTTTTTES